MTTCVHCDEVIVRPTFSTEDNEKERPFCCVGCLTVYTVLTQRGLGEYYDIKNSSGFFRPRAPVALETSEFQYLDNPGFKSDYVQKNNFQGETMEFYLEGIHCLACLWLIEKIPEFCKSVAVSKLDLDRSVVKISLLPGGDFASAVRTLSEFGYRPHPLKRNQENIDYKKKEERKSLLRIGVAGAAAGNIMIYSVSLYGGATGAHASLFNLLTVVFGIPVLTYSAYPFYLNAWNALKNKTMSIDIPIGLALLAGLGLGVFNLFAGVTHNYFDSLSMLVFLLLVSRFFLRLIQQKGLELNDLASFHRKESFLCSEDGKDFVEKYVDHIRPGEFIRIQKDMVIPVDGEIVSGESHLNNSLLTGESEPVQVKVGEEVFSGAVNLENDIILKVNKTKGETRLGQILTSVENGWSHKSKIVTLSTKISGYFTAGVFLLASIVFFVALQSQGLEVAFERAITMLIVTCPCALALTTPLAFTSSLNKAARNGIIIKGDDVIEKVAHINEVLLDKTGTVTAGQIEIQELKELSKTSLPLLDVILSLESSSNHPVGRALALYAADQGGKKRQVLKLIERPGVGVSGEINQQQYKIDSLGIWEDGQLVATYIARDLVRPDSRESVQELNKLGVNASILSGDKQSIVEKIASEVGVKNLNAFGGLSPEEKASYVKNHKNVMMVGDGANDAMAMVHADIGVAVAGALDISLKAADAYLSRPGIFPVVKLITLSRETMKVVKRNLVLSLFYNIISVFLVLAGAISPLIAAILMPISSLTVLLSTLIGTKKMRLLWK